jgi:mRNA-degrading endonuclease RelE of RelBE toxin-antitoxin system
MQILQTPTFKKAVKKLHANQKSDLDKAIRSLTQDPFLGEQKKGDLAFLRVYKFKMARQLTLLGYQYNEGKIVLTLMALGAHENFYRDVKKR